MSNAIRNRPVTAKKIDNTANIDAAMQGDILRKKVKIDANSFKPGSELRAWASFSSQGGVMKNFPGKMTAASQAKFEAANARAEAGLEKALAGMKGKTVTMRDIAIAAANHGEAAGAGWKP